MRTRRLKHSLSLAAVLLLSTLSACQSVPAFSQGSPSAMSSANMNIRRSIAVHPVPLSIELAYRPVTGCNYRYMAAPPNRPRIVQEGRFDIKPVRDRLLVTLASGGETGTALIGYDGRLYDYNVRSFGDGSRVNPKSFDDASRETIGELRLRGARGVHVINEVTALFPQFDRTASIPGERVASVLAENDQAWADYIYRGATTYGGANAMVLDLVRVFETAPGRGRLIVGFSIVDLSNMTPLLMVLDVGARLRFERGDCR